MRITIAGLGYVGLSLAVLLSQKNEVTAIDIDTVKVNKLNMNISPIRDPEIERFLREQVAGQRHLKLTATTSFEAAYNAPDLVVIAVPTNYNDETNHFDTSAVESVIETVLNLCPHALMVIKSTIPVGYTLGVREKYGVKNILFSPEFLREGNALYDNLHPSRIVVGADTDQRDEAEMVAALLREGAEEVDVPTVFCGPTEAEAIKLFSNTYLALRVSYFNELDTYAQVKGLDTGAIIAGVCQDPRIGDSYNNPSFGYGGYCLPKDTKQLLANYQNVPQNLIEAVVKSNATRKAFVADAVISLKPETVGVFRLTMKSASDNFRSAAIHDVILQLRERGVRVIIYEPVTSATEMDGCPVLTNLEQFKTEADIVLANRYDSCLDDISEKVYTRDLYFRD